MERNDYGFKRVTCGCRMCQIPCEHMPGMLAPDDVARIAEHLGYKDIDQFAAENLLASPGAVVMFKGHVIRLPTLVPARQASGACKFYKSGNCTIHEAAPFGCAFVDMHGDRFDSQMQASLYHVMQEHVNGGEYSRLVLMLQAMDRVAPPPEVGRGKIAAALAAEGV